MAPAVWRSSTHYPGAKMRSTDGVAAVRGEPAPPPEDDFDVLRNAFTARLQNERVHFTALGTALAGRDANYDKIFGDLVFRAHRLRGAAEIFEEVDVARAAEALEEAAAAVKSPIKSSDAVIRAVLERMVNVIEESLAATALGKS
jgi:hypothetical protein